MRENLSVEIEMVPISDLIPYINNTKKHDEEQIKKVASSIKEFEFLNPIIIDKNNEIIAGHCRYEASKLLKLQKIPCIVASNLTEAQVKAYRIADNKLAESPWDYEMLQLELESLQEMEYNIDFSGFSLDDLHEMIIQNPENISSDVEDDDFEPEYPDDPITQTGDIWILGPHRLLCGDSTKREDVAKLMDGALADLVVTDPPYNVDYQGKTKDALKIQNDKMSTNAFQEFITAAYSNFHEFSKPGAGIYVFHADTEGVAFRQCLVDAGYYLAQCCVWVKNHFVLGRQDYHHQHEPILVGWKKGAAHNWYSDRKQTTVWNFDKPLRSEEHPTMKPVPLIAYPIQNSSKHGDIVLDLFEGSGSHIEACHQTGRIGYGMELDPKYCDVIVNRYLRHADDVKLIRNGETINYSDIKG